MTPEFPSYTDTNNKRQALVRFQKSLDGIDSALYTTPFTFAFSQNSVMLSFDKHNVWNPQGGHCESGESIEQTVIREAYEEAGIRISQVEFIGAMVFDVQKVFDSTYTRTYPLLSYLPVSISEIVTIDEQWIPLETTQRKLCDYDEAVSLLLERPDNGYMAAVYTYCFQLYHNRTQKN